MLLQNELDRQKENGKEHGYQVTDDSPVFIQKSGELLLPETVTHAFKKMIVSIGDEDMGFHDLRHTHATF